ncbi:hypothetical protein OK016_07640 [Vibrio chagasii]|nr:hypothetical protein [Vibrio chagasii]
MFPACPAMPAIVTISASSNSVGEKFRTYEYGTAAQLEACSMALRRCLMGRIDSSPLPVALH